MHLLRSKLGFFLGQAIIPRRMGFTLDQFDFQPNSGRKFQFSAWKLCSERELLDSSWTATQKCMKVFLRGRKCTEEDIRLTKQPKYHLERKLSNRQNRAFHYKFTPKWTSDSDMYHFNLRKRENLGSFYELYGWGFNVGSLWNKPRFSVTLLEKNVNERLTSLTLSIVKRNYS